MIKQRKNPLITIIFCLEEALSKTLRRFLDLLCLQGKRKYMLERVFLVFNRPDYVFGSFFND